MRDVHETTWEDVCTPLAEASGGDNTVDTARRDACLDKISGTLLDALLKTVKHLNLLWMACEASPFDHDGCDVFA